MNLLALDTSTEACSVALQRSDGYVCSRYAITPRGHTEHLPIMLDAVMQESAITRQELTHIAFANGPGAFTGVRIAAATAQGIAVALGLPLVAVSTLAVLAQQGFIETGQKQLFSAIDARMGEAYCGLYAIDDQDIAELQQQESLLALNAIKVPEQALGVGSAFSALTESGIELDSSTSILPELLPRATALLPLAIRAIESGRAGSAADVQINYLRNQVAEKKKNPAPQF